MSFEAKCMATAIGSVPHTDVDTACKLVFDNLKDIPIWPQLPNLGFKENIYVQCTEGMPGIAINEAEEKVSFDTTRDIVGELENLYNHYINNEVDALAISPDHAKGLYRYLEILRDGDYPDIKMLKGHIVGPLTIGFTVSDQNKKPGFYDDVLREGIIKTLAMKAMFQVEKFKEVRPDLPALIFIDDPYITSIGSAFVSLNRDEVVAYLNEITGAIDGYTGIHCCANTDWGLLAETNVDVISFDAYDFSETVALYPAEMKAFLDRGGVLAWGIVPSGLPTPDQVTKETAETLLDKLEAGMQLLVDKGIDKETIVNQALITPSCGTGTMKPEHAELTFTLSRQISEAMRKKYGLGS